ncbi:MAG: hypothetical protein JXA15_14495, partial [Spirochaetales bacterium]|nr:hypothetical protein [Spirochaetales bacterium]
MTRREGVRIHKTGAIAAIVASLFLISCATAPEPAELGPETVSVPPAAKEDSPPSEAAVTYLAPAPAPEAVGVPLYEPAAPVAAPASAAAASSPDVAPPEPKPAPAVAGTAGAKPAPAVVAARPATAEPATKTPAAPAPSATPAPALSPPPDPTTPAAVTPSAGTAPALSPVSAPMQAIAVTPLGAPDILDPAELSRGPDLEFGVRKGDRFEIRVSGSGWTYLGEAAGQEGIGYEHRRFQEGDAIFSLTADRAGDYLLDFRRLDPLLGVPESKSARIVVADAATPVGAPLSGLGTGIMGSVTGSMVATPSPSPAPVAAGSVPADAGAAPPASTPAATGSVPAAPPASTPA